MNLKGKKFKNSRLGMEIYVYEVEGKEMFIGKDVADMLGYLNPSTAISENVKQSQRKKFYINTIENIGYSEIPKNANINMITEIGLYQLVMRSSLPSAEEFQKWVYEEVLPSIRKNNIYAESNITQEEVMRYSEENKVFRNIIKNLQAGVAKSKDLETLIRDRFPNIIDGYDQVIVKFKENGILNEEGFPTEAFMEINNNHNWIRFISTVTNKINWKIVLTSDGVNAMAKTLKEVDGEIIFDKIDKMFDI